MALVSSEGLPIALQLHEASPHEVRLVYDLVQQCWTRDLPERVIGDKAFDSDGLDEQMWNECDVEVIAPHRDNRTRPKTQDGRCLRRAKRRWKVERFFAWAQNFRRLVVRYERKASNFYGFLLIAATIMHVKYQY